MRLTTAGLPVGFREPIVGAVTTSQSPEPPSTRKHNVLVGSLDRSVSDLTGFRAIISTDGSASADEVFRASDVPVVHSVRHIDHLREGDVVAINPANGFIRTVYRPDSAYNTLFITERCNSNCLMCSQPPKDIDDTDYLYKTNLEVIKFISPKTSHLTITGGEPTLLGARLFCLLSELKHNLPDTRVHMLTNGRSFAWSQCVRSLAAVAHPNLSLGIPLYQITPRITIISSRPRGPSTKRSWGYTSWRDGRYQQKLEWCCINFQSQDCRIWRSTSVATFRS